MTKQGLKKKSLFAFWVVVGPVLQNSPATAINNPEFRKGVAIKTLKFCRILAKFEDHCVVHVDE